MSQIINQLAVNNFIEKPLKVYPYNLSNYNKNIPLLESGAATLLHIDNKNHFDKYKLKKDENDYYYFDAIPNIEIINTLTSSNITSLLPILEKELNIEIFSNNQPENSANEMLNLGYITDFTPFLYTVGKPFNKADFDMDMQSLYLSSPILAIQETELEEKTIIDLGYKTSTLINFKNILTSYKSISFNVFESNDNYYANADTINLELPAETIISTSKGIFGTSSGPNDTFKNLDFEIHNTSLDNLIPFKMTPINSNNNRLDVVADWFDYDMCLPLWAINKIKTYSDLTAYLNDNSAIQALEDILLVSHVFSTSFSDIPTIDSGTEIGKIKNTSLLGNAKLKTSLLVGQNPINICNQLVQNWYRTNDIKQTDQSFKKLKHILNSLSQYIYTQYAIALGQNSFNQIYLPWFLNISGIGTIQNSTNADWTQLNSSNITINQNTRFFNKNSTNTMELKEETTNLSSIKLVQTDRKLTLPQIEEQIEIITKLPLPGDINTKSNVDLKYFTYLKAISTTNANDLFTTLFGKEDGKIIPVGHDIILNSQTRYGGFYQNDDASITEKGVWDKAREEQWLLEQAANELKVDISTLKFVNNGSKQEIKQDTKQLNIPDWDMTHSIAYDWNWYKPTTSGNPYSLFFQTVLEIPQIGNRTTRAALTTIGLQYLAVYFNSGANNQTALTDYSLVQTLTGQNEKYVTKEFLVDNAYTTSIKYDGQTAAWDLAAGQIHIYYDFRGITYQMSKFKYNGYTVHSTHDVTIDNLDRQIIFNKAEFQSLLEKTYSINYTKYNAWKLKIKDTFSTLSTIQLNALWMDTLKLSFSIGATTSTIETIILPSKWDELIGNVKILLH